MSVEAGTEASAQAWLGAQAGSVRRWTWAAAAAGLAAAAAWIAFAASVAGVAGRWIAGEAAPGSAIVLMPVLLVLRSALLATREWAGSRAGLRLRERLRGRLLDALEHLGPLRAAAGSDGALATVIVEQVDALDGYFARYRPQRLLAAGVPLLVVAAIVPHSWLAALLLAATAPLIPAFMVLVGHGAAAAGRRQAAALATLGGRFLDLVRGLPALRLAGRTGWGAEGVREGAHGYRRRSLQVLRIAFLSSTVLELFASAAIAMVALYLGLALLGRFPVGHYGQPMTLEPALFVLLLAPEFFAPLRQLGTDYHLRAQALAAAGPIQDLLRRAPAQALPAAATVPARPPGPPVIEFDAVSLRHPDGRLALDRVSFRIAAGQRVALTGASGSGKSSVLALLAGFVAPTAGRILVDGVGLAAWPRSAWWRRLAWLEQRPEWFGASLRDNVLVGLDRDDDARLAQALAAAGLAADVAALPEQAETVIGSAGIGLSGGQLQRLALARALARQADLWLLDEPLAQLDAQTAAALRTSLAASSRGCTLLIATHDDDETLLAGGWIDRRIVLAGGAVAGDAPLREPAAGGTA